MTNENLDQTLNQFLQSSTSFVRQEALKVLYRQSLFATAKHLLDYKDTNHHTHDKMIKALEAPSKRKLIVMPRGTFKSSICCVAYPIWLLMQNPNLRILIDSEIFTNSKNFLSETKNHLNSSRFVSIFGSWQSNDNWTQTSITLNTRTKNLKEASITCSGVGATKVGQHYDVIIGDDYNSDKNSANPEQRKKVVDHYRMNLSILEPEGIYVIVGTRYAADDVIGHILTNEVIHGDRL